MSKTIQLHEPSATGTPTEVVERAEIAALLEGVMIPARGFALRLSANEADADDLLQEAAVRAFRFFHQFTPGSNFRAWFYRIVANCFYRSVRSEGRRGVQVSFEDAPSLLMHHGVDTLDSDPANQLLSMLDSEEIVGALGDLPQDFRGVALLYFLEDLSYEQIAQLLDVPIGTVRSRLYRARRILQRDLWSVAAEYGLVRSN